ncbi:MAG: hypothetical protein ACXVBH_06765, partial [Flavisolibacter sp.]
MDLFDVLRDGTLIHFRLTNSNFYPAREIVNCYQNVLRKGYNNEKHRINAVLYSIIVKGLRHPGKLMNLLFCEFFQKFNFFLDIRFA